MGTRKEILKRTDAPVPISSQPQAAEGSASASPAPGGAAIGTNAATGPEDHPRRASFWTFESCLRWFIPVVGALTVPVWFATFPLVETDSMDLLFEGSHFCGAALGLFFILRLQGRALAVGWNMFTYALLLDFLDEFVEKSAAVDIAAQGLFETGGLMTVVVGFYHSHQFLQSQLERSQRAEERFRTVARAVTDLVYEWDIEDGRVSWFGAAEGSFEGFHDQLPGSRREWKAKLHPDDRVRHSRSFHKDLAESPSLELDYRIEGSQGNYRYWSERGTILRDAAGKPYKVTGAVSDITERRRAEEIKEREERYALAVRGANDGLWDWDLRNNLFYFSERWKAMLSYRDDEVGSEPDEWFRRVHPDDRERLKRSLDAHRGAETEHFECEHRILHRDGDYRWMLSRGLAVRGDDGKAFRMAGSQTDVTDRKFAEEQLLHDALHDALTGLPNRSLFMDRLQSATVRSRRRPGYLFAVLFLDLDRFKVLNDSIGHMVGDQLLIDVAQRLQSCLRAGDTVARLGGDEFTILLDDLGRSEEVEEVADRIQRRLELPFSLEGREVTTSCSMGIRLSDIGYDKPEDVLRDADIAMYRAKASGGARYELFESVMHDRAMQLMELDVSLRRAVSGQEFVIYYQPIIGIETLEIEGFEALLRWMHPERGLVPPGEFIPFAEETGKIVEITEWLIDATCKQLKDWMNEDLGTLFMSINIAACHFQREDLVDTIDSALVRTDLDPKRLQIELTESTLMDNTAVAANVLQQLQEQGVRIAIDDFGTGYSSLSYLARFPLHTLKIDRSFIHDLTRNPHNAEIVRAVVGLANGLNIKTTAEGVETRDEFEYLRSLQCAQVQGHLFARAEPPEIATELLVRQKAQRKQQPVLA